MKSLIHKNQSYLLEEIFSTSTAKILDFLLMNNGLNYTENDITSLTDIQPRTFSRVMQILVQQKLVKRTRNNRTYHYEADLSSSRTRCLLDFLNITLINKIPS